MLAELVQFLFAGLTAGAIYALVGLGFGLIYNASHVINFAQGEFVMLGGMTTVFAAAAGLPLAAAVAVAILVTVAAGLALEMVAVPTRNASVVTLIIITIGASISYRGAAQAFFDKQFHTLPSFSGEDPIDFLGAAILPQTLWVLGITVLIVIALQLFFHRTLLGKAVLATSHNRLAARLVGINVQLVLLLSFGLSAALGAIAGVLITPITSTNFEVGIMLGLKGFCAAILGGLGSGVGAVVGGLLVGLIEAFGAGYISSEYKDAMAFGIILLVLFFMPSGLFGKRTTERV
ncbi:branched-chain amino acid ABC transporter permease [Roseospirillum parvum]|uniref:Branched-chain amino acid transport system permease protein n=1 Tax=Roseospirillum parvum TaxID=83401 RepID=A0A1G8E4P6_9PROT|nr:branched-chain amino acid ABC transporter permease [Roseospirillum parvum]SDH64619.1 branched-chain amino acid transport system permease protein [Roseospirillum parvum]